MTSALPSPGARTGPPAAGTSHPGAQDTAVRSAVLRFTGACLVAFLVLVTATVLLAGQVARHRALGEARSQGADLASRLAAPLVDGAVRQHRPGASTALARAMSSRMRDGSLRHVKIWDTSGRVVWSDESTLVGRRFPLKPDVAELFGTTRATAEVSDLTREENTVERDEGELVEVYAGAFDADGRPLVVEAYLTTTEIRQDQRAILLALLPLSIGAPTLFLIAVVPIAVRFGRRIHQAQAAEARAMKHALLASDLERRRLAVDLHDGVIQDLAGLCYALRAVDGDLRPDGDHARVRVIVDRAADLLHGSVARLRSLMTDLYPPDVEGDGLRDALDALAHKVGVETGADVTLTLPSELEISPVAGRLVYRVAREALRNVVKHAAAGRVTVDVSRDPVDVWVAVTDDGRGPGYDGESAHEGHLGLRLLRDTIRDAGGDLEVRPHLPSGTALVARVPARTDAS